MILHLNIPAFPIEVERLAEPALRSRPVAIAASTSPRAPLLYVSAEAHRAGIHKGMLLKHARSLERDLRWLIPQPRRYERAQRRLWRLVSRFSPVLEPLRLGSVFLDMSGMELLFGKAAAAADVLRSELLEDLAMNPTVGVGSNKLVSRVAAKVMRPHGLYEVFPGHEAEFLQPLPVTYLPGVGRGNADRLFRELGVRQIGDLAQIPLPILTRVFGGYGVEWHRRATGEDTTPVELPRAAPALHFETTFNEPSNDDDFLLAELWRLCERAGFALRERKQMVDRTCLQGIYVDGIAVRKNFRYGAPTQSDFALFHPWSDSWHRFMERRLQFKSLRLTLRGLQGEFFQLSFTSDVKEQRLLDSLDGLRRRYGAGAVVLGRSLLSR